MMAQQTTSDYRDALAAYQALEEKRKQLQKRKQIRVQL